MDFLRKRKLTNFPLVVIMKHKQGKEIINSYKTTADGLKDTVSLSLCV